jgi:hypothetical protein
MVRDLHQLLAMGLLQFRQMALAIATRAFPAALPTEYHSDSDMYFINIMSPPILTT